MAEINTASSVSRVLETAALDRIRALFNEQARRGEVRVPVWSYGLDEPDRVFVCRLSDADPAPFAAESECLDLLSGIFAAAGLAEPDRDPRDDRPDPDRFAAVWLDPLLDGQGVAESGDYGFSRPGDEYCVCGAYTPEEKAAADRRIGISDFSPDAIAHARRLCRLLQLDAPMLILQHAATDLAESLTLHRHAGSCEVITIPVEQRSEKRSNLQMWKDTSHSAGGIKMTRLKKTDARMSAETLIARNAKLMREFSIETPEDLKEALGDLYHNQETRKALLDRLSEKNRILLRGFYYHNCPAGLDRFPACVKVTIDWAYSDVWIPKDRDHIKTIKAEFDRIKFRVTFKCQTQLGTQITFKASLDETFAEEFFSLADRVWSMDPSGVNALDADRFSVECVFGEGSIRQSVGNHPDYHPYGELYDLMRDLFSKLRRVLD